MALPKFDGGVVLGEGTVANAQVYSARIRMKWRRYADNSAYESRYVGVYNSLSTPRMAFNTDSKYPARRTYVVKARGDAKPDVLAGCLENLVTGRQIINQHCPALCAAS